MFGLGKRRQYIINPEFQWGLIARIFAILTINNILVYSSVKYFFKSFFDEAIRLNVTPSHPVYAFVAEQEQVILSLMLLAICVSFLVIMFFGVFYSHKVAGPMYKLRTHLNEVSDSGQIKSVSFRKGDYFQDVADAFNKMVEKLKK